MNITHAQRIGLYGSLSDERYSNDGVEKVNHHFGWDRGIVTTREEVLKRDCAEEWKYVDGRRVRNFAKAEMEGFVMDECRVQRMGCKKLKRDSRFEEIIVVPLRVMLCYLDRDGDYKMVRKGTKGYEECQRVIGGFEREYLEGRENVMFLMDPRPCFNRLGTSNFWSVGSSFYQPYWDARREDDGRRGMWKWDEREVHVGIHVRRGDFFLERYSNRVLVKDVVYARILKRIIEVVEEDALKRTGRESRRRYRIHVYSQGKAKSGDDSKIDHDVSKARHLYVSENGEEQADDYWMNLLLNMTDSANSLRDRVSWDLQISANTLESIDGMTSCDIFVGGTSGLAAHIVRMYARGVLLLMKESLYEDPKYKFVQIVDVEGTGHLSRFDTDEPKDPHISVTKFRKYWQDYVKDFADDIDNP